MTWAQVFVLFDPWATAEGVVVQDLAPAFAHLETAGLISSWFFVRKHPCWRIRFRPTDPTTSDATTALHQHLTELTDTGQISAWTPPLYEPESYAFGGLRAMTTAHDLFHRDSRAIMTYLGTRCTDKRRELSIMLYSQLLRSAGQDWYEQGDVWARVGQHRTLPHGTSPDRIQQLRTRVHRLLTIDPATLEPNNADDTAQDQALVDWTAAFSQTGSEVADLARTGALTRGLRAVLAHHILFAWNRLGIPHAAQSVLAHAAKAAVFND